MKRRAVFGVVGAGLLAGCAGVPPAPSGDAYVFAYFTGNGEDGLHLAGSRDGYRWDALNGGRSFLAPAVGKAKLMRDPCILRGPDGIYRMVWTSGWNETGIGYASSPDLVHWSTQRELPVMAHEPTALNAWAPEIAWDDRRGEYLIFWSSTIPGRFAQSEAAGDNTGNGAGANKYNHRIYATTTRDFATFTPTRLFYDPGFSVIDATFVRTTHGDWLLVKDETRHPPRKYLQLARAASLQGPFAPLAAPITPAGLWTEGPTALQVGADIIVYYDAYTARHYGALRSRDLVHWEDVTAAMRFPDEGTPRRMRHGTALQVPAGVLATLRAR
jgi:beta-xylosidase